MYSHVDCKGIFLQNKLDQLFNQTENGFFIELGANNGLFQSNTAFLEFERNWKGILIEPSVKGYNECNINRPNSICVNCACVSDDFKDEFIYGDFEDGHAMASINGMRTQSNELCKVKVLTLEHILDEYNIKNIDFLSLDTEGYELEILKGLNLDKYTPKYMLIEIYDKDFNDILQFLISKKYKLHSNFTNYNKQDNPCWDGSHNDYLFIYE